MTKLAKMPLLALSVLALASASETLASQPGPSRQQAEVDAVGQRYAPAIRRCYQEGGLKEDPALRGRLRVGALVLAEGSIRNPMVTASQVHGLGMPAVVECVQGLVASWHFNGGAFRAQRIVLLFDLVPVAPR